MSPRLSWALAAAVALLATWHTTTTGWLPQGPLADPPDVGAGSDWDWQLELAFAADAYRARGWTPQWDPHPQHGEPLRANPQAFFRHPAYVLGDRIGGYRDGFRALYGWCLLTAMGGMAALAWRLRLPPVLGVLAVLPLLLGPEWRSRLVGGHLWVLGVSVWPAALALASRARGRRAWLWAAAAGFALGTATWMGSHYGMPLGLLFCVWVIWSDGLPPWMPWALAALLLLPVLLTTAPAGARVGLELACFLLFGAGLALRWRKAGILLALGLGLLATAGAMAVESSWLLAGDGRLTGWSWQPKDTPFPPLTLEHLLHGPGMGLYMKLPSLGWWVAAALGVAGLALRSPAMAAMALAAVGVAWGSGRPLKPWLFVSALPGATALSEHARFQVLLWFVSPLGLLVAVHAGGEAAARWLRARWPRGPDPWPTAWLPGAAAVLVGAWLHGPYPDAFADDPETLADLDGAEGWGVLRRVHRHDGLLSGAPAAGDVRQVRSHLGLSVLVPPPGTGDALAWRIDGGRFVPDPSLEVDAVLNRWTVRAQPGQVVVLAQRDWRGWRCDGARIGVDGEHLVAEHDHPFWEDYEATSHDHLPERPVAPGTGDRWLTLEMQQDEARCVWRSPVAGRAAAVQALAGVLLVGLLGLGWRLQRSDEPA